MERPARSTQIASGRHGIALPMALLGLVAVSILITGILLTGSTETAMSFAHRDATRSFYGAEGAIEAYVASTNISIQPVSNFTYTPPGPNTVPVRITVEQLSEELNEGDSNRRFAVRSEPLQGGRAVVAMVQVRQSTLGEFNAGGLDAAITFGGDATITGNSLVSDGTDNPYCTDEAPAANAILHAEGTTVEKKGNAAEIDGNNTESDLDPFALIDHVLGGVSIRDLAWGADIKFGPYFQKPLFPAKEIVHSKNNNEFDWSCPQDLIAKVNPNSPQAKCDAGAIASEYKIVAIDGGNKPVEIGNWHGQGMLIVINGTLVIDAQFVYSGIIIAERNIVIKGGGQTAPTIEGAIISAGMVVGDEEDLIDPGDGETAGKAVVRFNRCAINAVQDALNNRPGEFWGEPRVQGRTYGWFEVVR